MDASGARGQLEAARRSAQRLFDAANALNWATQASQVLWARKGVDWISHGDGQWTAGKTVSLAAGASAGLFVYEGGIRAIAQDAQVSIQAHTDQLNWRAQQELTVTSSNDAIEVLAQDKVTLKGGNTSIELDGGNITLRVPATLDIKGTAKTFVDMKRDAAVLDALPQGEPEKGTLYLDHRYHDGEGLAGAEYVVRLPGGGEQRGTLDNAGKAEITGIPAVGGTVSFGPATGAFERKDKTPMPKHDPNPGRNKIQDTIDRYVTGQGPAADNTSDSSANDSGQRD